MWYNNLGQVIRYVNSGELLCREEYITRKGWNSRALVHDERDREATEIIGRRWKSDNKKWKAAFQETPAGSGFEERRSNCFANVGS